MKPLTLVQPKRIVFGSGRAQECAIDILALGLRRAFMVTSPPVRSLAEPLLAALQAGGAAVAAYDGVATEPSVTMLNTALAEARAFGPDAVIGLGGGSALDVAKLVAALHNSDQDPQAVLGTNLLRGRTTFLACLPTTSGTGSEVSPNAILLHEAENLKKGTVSPSLCPDAAYVDSRLTHTAPPSVTATAGMDALTHCIEAYANLNAHPLVDAYALEGIRLIGAHLARAVAAPADAEAREAMSLGSLYGGLCLAPVGTAAVHALAYPLGGQFHVAHGASNALLLPPVMAANLPAMPERYAQIALALGASPGGTALETAQQGVERIRALMRQIGIIERLSALGIPRDSLPGMAVAAVGITRLMRNNPRPLTTAEAEAIYEAVY